MQTCTRSSQLVRTVLGTFALLAFAAPAGAQPISAFWDASSGLLPNQVCPAWTTIDTNPTADPVIANGALTVTTTAGSETMAFIQNLDPPGTGSLEVDARVQLVSGSSTAANRGPAMIVITSAANAGVIFVIDSGQIFITQSGDVKGPSANVDTTAAFHTYHIEVSQAGAVNVLYDGAPTLTGFTYTNPAIFGADRRIIWGEGADEAFGTSHWQFLNHNGAVCPSGTTTTAASTTTTSTTSLPGSTTTVVGGTSTSTTSHAGSTTTSTSHAGSTTTSTSRPGNTVTTTSRPAGNTLPTTTTTLPGQTCNGNANTLDDVLCRLDALRARIVAESDLKKFQSKAISQTTKAISLAQQAASACDTRDTKKAKSGVKKAQRQLINLAHRLRSLNARKQLDPTLRNDIAGQADAIRGELHAMKGNPCAG